MTSCNSSRMCQVAEQYPVDVQRVVADEPGAGEQGEDVFQWPQHSRWPLPERVASGRVTCRGTTLGWARANWREVVGDGGQLDGPVRVGVVHRELREHELGDTVKHRGLLGDVAVEHHRIRPTALLRRRMDNPSTPSRSTIASAVCRITDRLS